MTHQITAAAFRQLIVAGYIIPGDMVNVESGEPGLLGWAIAKTQYHLLLDLEDNEENRSLEAVGVIVSKMTEDEAEEAAKYTHTACVVDAVKIAELYRPCARTRTWDELLQPGTVIQIRRPCWLAPGMTEAERGIRISQAAMVDVTISRPYPTSELVRYYLWRWGFQKLFIGRKFMDVFRSKSNDVCSGSYWRWCLAANAINVDGLGKSEIMAESYYPARLAMDKHHFVTVARYEIVSQVTSGCSAGCNPCVQTCPAYRPA